jgi:hypothetical protein
MSASASALDSGSVLGAIQVENRWVYDVQSMIPPSKTAECGPVQGTWDRTYEMRAVEEGLGRGLANAFGLRFYT